MKLKISLIIFLFLIIRIHNCKSQDTISIFYIPDKGSYNSYYDFINDKQDSIYNSCNSDSINRIYISIRNGPYQDTVEWRLSGSNNLVQKGFFDKSGLASGKFEQFINLNYTSTCEYKNGKKNGILKIKFRINLASKF